ncbi:hypothetical protein IEQ34_021937 [Dendrobium chrysotoxum]|uniref:Uncharacterized protein n=1 Tax=Dendrobium chrysotoxum TaxID=161865 RepID=A0AAV7FW84_DENCH|nr:hypothetical protein IEQ34_021937 [Dendrobium chrysotoxum]
MVQPDEHKTEKVGKSGTIWSFVGATRIFVLFEGCVVDQAGGSPEPVRHIGWFSQPCWNPII